LNVCVVGGAGFLGSHAVDSLLDAGHEVVVIDNFLLGKMSNLKDAVEKSKINIYNEDARQLMPLQEIILKEKIDVVVNLAMKCLPTSFDDPEGSYMVGVQIAHNLVYMLRKKQYNHLIHLSSSEVYGTATECLMSETHPTVPTTPYGAGKLAADHLLLSYHNMFNCKVSVIRPFNLVGPRQNWNAYAAVVPLTIKRIMNGESPIINGDGQQSRDFNYVKDVANLIPELLETDAFVGKAVNVGRGKETTIKRLIELICKEMDYPISKIKYAPERLADVRRHCADISLAKKLIDYEPKTSLEEAIKSTVTWYRSELK